MPSPSPCAPDVVTAGVAAGISNEYGSSPQITFSSSEPISSTPDPAGTLFTQASLGGLSVPQIYTSGTLYSYVQSYRWRKGNAYVSRTQTSNLVKPPTVLYATLRTSRVWVDRRTLYTMYTLQDEDGSFYVDTSSGFEATVTTSGTTVDCSYMYLTLPAYRHLDSCSQSVELAEFAGLSEDTPRTVVMAVTPGAGLTNIEASLGSVMLTPPPNWWGNSLRDTTSGTRRNAPIYVDTSAFVTLPTHPVYATSAGVTDTFEAIVFANEDAYAVESWTIEVMYDSSKLTYVGYAISSDYSAPTIGDSYSGHYAIKTFMTTAPSAAGAATPANRRGVFFMMSLSFKVVAGTVAGTHTDLLRVQLVSFINTANNAFVTTQMARILDQHDSTPSGSTSGSMAVVAISDVDLLPYVADWGGQLLHTHTLTGVTALREYGGTLITDYQLTPRTNAYSAATLTTCTVTSNGAAFALSAVGGSCLLEPQPSLSSTALVRFTAGDGNLSFPAVSARIVVPSEVSITVDDTELNRILGVDCSAAEPEYGYQRTAVHVYASGFDVTSLAINLVSSNATVADFVTSTNAVTDSIVRGKTEGTAKLSMFSGASVHSPTITVSSVTVTATALRNRVITAVSWSVAPPTSFTFPSGFSSSLLLQQVFTQRPAGETRAHYGFLFSTVVWSDGFTEDVSGSQTSTNTSSPNIVWTVPGGTDSSVPSLTIANEASDQWMVAVAPDANEECIIDSATATFQRCGTDVITDGVPMYIDVPKPNGILFSIVQSVLAPLNDGASASPFGKPTTSGFALTVLYDDGSQVSGYAAESGVLYSTNALLADDEDALGDMEVASGEASGEDSPVPLACGVVDNDANTLTIAAGATCTLVNLSVSVTIGPFTFHASDASVVTRLSSVMTFVDAYPSGGSNIAGFHPLPCLTDTYERGRLRTVGRLQTGEQGVLTLYMTYVSSVPSVAAPLDTDDTIVVPVASGSALIGGASELSIPGVSTTGVAVTPVSVVVDSAARTSISMSSSWTLTDSSTMSLVAGDTRTTQFTLGYTEGGNPLFTYSNFMTNYAGWFNASEILTFASSAAAYVAIDYSGTLMQLANNYQKVTLTASLVCEAESWSRDVWSNLLPATEDVDMGTALNNAYSPYYLTSGSWMQIYVWSRPKSGQYLRATQIRVTLPTGMTSAGATFTDDSGLGYVVFASFNVEGSQIMGLTATHPATVPVQGKIRLGYFMVPVTGSGLLSGPLSVEVVSIQSDTHAADGAAGNIRSTKASFQSVAAASLVYIGTPTRRRQLDGRMAWVSPMLPPGPRVVARRALSACDPCTFELFGDVNGDCAFNVNDVTAAQTFATEYSVFATGSSTTNPLDTWTNENGYSCAWVKEQLNPTLNLLDGSFGGDNPADARYGQPNINSQDVIHLSRATQYMSRFLSLSASCVGSADALGDRPDLLLVAQPYGGVGQDSARVLSTEQSAAVGTEVYFEIIIAPNASSPQYFNVSKGTQLTEYSNPYSLYGAATTVPISPIADYSRASGSQAGILVQAEYDASNNGYIARLQPFRYDGDVQYYAAVAVEQRGWLLL